MDQAVAESVMRCGQSGRGRAGQDSVAPDLPARQIGNALCHSGAMRSIESGIHFPRRYCGAMDSGPTPSAYPGMTLIEYLNQEDSNYLRRSRQHHLRQKLLALLLGAVALHGRGKALEDAVFERRDDGVVHIALAADRRRLGKL